MRLLAVALLCLGCNDAPDRPAPKPVEPVAARACESVELELELASRILADDAHPCRARVEAAHGRMIALGLAFSGTVVATTPARGAGLVITCQHCTGAEGSGLREPEVEDPATVHARAPARLAGGKVTSGRESQLYFVYRLFSRPPPKSAFDAKGHLAHIVPADDFVVGTLDGAPTEVIGHLGVLPRATVSDQAVALHDPQEIARSSRPWAEAKPGSFALLLGFPRDLPDKAFGGELVASVGEILDDTRAAALLLRSDPDEAAIPYDPAIEMVVAARAVPGMSGGGAFDADGRYLGVNVRGTLQPVDGTYLVRVVRAPYILRELASALAAAPEATRTKVSAFLPK